jgi:hypothetical protein
VHGLRLLSLVCNKTPGVQPSLHSSCFDAAEPESSIHRHTHRRDENATHMLSRTTSSVANLPVPTRPKLCSCSGLEGITCIHILATTVCFLHTRPAENLYFFLVLCMCPAIQTELRRGSTLMGDAPRLAAAGFAVNVQRTPTSRRRRQTQVEVLEPNPFVVHVDPRLASLLRVVRPCGCCRNRSCPERLSRYQMQLPPVIDDRTRCRLAHERENEVSFCAEVHLWMLVGVHVGSKRYA